MKNVLYIIFLAIIFLGVGCTKESDHKNHNIKKEQKASKKYVCPMHPQITSDKPAQCSICGMDLVLFEDDEEEMHERHEHNNEEGQSSNKKTEENSLDKQKPSDRADVKLSLEKQQIIGITTEKAHRMELFKKVSAPGRIAFDPELYTAQSEYLEALRQWNKVKDSPLKEVKRSTNEMIRSSKTRLKVMGLSSEQIDQLSKKGRVSDALIVGSSTGENLIYADVFEADLSKIKSGQSVSITGSFLSGEEIKGKVVSVDQVIDPKTRTGKVRIKVEKTKALIRPEAFVNVSIAVPLGKQLVIPRESVLDTGKELFVFIKKGEGKFEPRRISKIFETDEYVAVLSGVSEDDTVVTSAQFMLDSESRLKAVIKQAGQSSHNH